MKNIRYYLTIILFLAVLPNLFAREIIGKERRVAESDNNKRILAGCSQPVAKTDLDINNVRATIFTASDMWWDLIGDPRYEVPKNSKRYSVFAGSIWIGGIDAGKQLRVAAQTYRQQAEYDFWSGPLDDSAEVTPDVCRKFDQHFKVMRKEIEVFAASSLPPSPTITSWPGNTETGEMLAPFHDANGNGQYEPNLVLASGDKDYPNFNLGKPSRKKGFLLGDQVLWWVFNDKGNIHTASKPAQSIGLEVQAQAFAFENKPGDPVSNMTFYQYKITNKSHTEIDSAYFGQWVDPDLGKYDDDYVGCDVNRGLGYCYNGDQDDEGPKGYGLNPPAVGVDFFEGPRADSLDGVDNNRNGIVDEAGELIIMSQFVYFNNDATVQGNPSKGQDYYNYLRGIWRDGIHMTYGGNGKGSGPGATFTSCNFMFPDNTDKTFSTPWTEVTAGNVAADRRFIQSAGSFTLKPGAVNYITTGVVWARANSGGPQASVQLLKTVDDKAQALFDNNFNKTKGPDAPDLAIRELNGELLLTLSNNSTSNNYKESYLERDQDIIITTDTSYKFQGYQVFQLKDATVLGSYLDPETNTIDPDKARVVAQSDVLDDVGQIYNFTGVVYDTISHFQGSAMVYQAAAPNDFLNKGIKHSFKVTKDYFTNDKLINNKTYYYTAIAYGYNKAETRNPKISLEGSYKPYIAGSRNSKVYNAVPHLVAPENGGQILHSNFGDGPRIKRIRGYGNGGNALDLIVDDNTFAKYLSNVPYRIDTALYDFSSGPVSVRIVDPVKVPKDSFILKLDSVTNRSRWTLTSQKSGLTFQSDTTIGVNNEQIISKWGLSISVNQVKNPLADKTINPVLTSTMVFADSTQKWLTGVMDGDLPFPSFDPQGNFLDNWIRAGTNGRDLNYAPYGTIKLDPNQYFEKVLNGTWAPYSLVWDTAYYPAPSKQSSLYTDPIRNANIQLVSSVSLVITRDKSKWTRCPVLEMHEDPTVVQNVKKLSLKSMTPSVDKDGNQESTSKGMGWFPGYAVSMETGERLNIMFGEDSFLGGENGNDMLWNPSSNFVTPSGELVFGGKHFIYIMARSKEFPKYNPDTLALLLKAPTPPVLRTVFKHAIWVNIPVLKAARYAFTGNLPPSDVRIRLCVSRPYKRGYNQFEDTLASPYYTFSTEGLANETNNFELAKTSMDLIRVVPNPYYAHSDYETQQFENKIKITNLPPRCTINIFTVNGSLVRTITKENSGDTSFGADRESRNAVITNSVDWDLKNSVGIPIASGIYIFHIQSDGLPDKVIKWFGVVRPLDLSNY